MESPLELNQQMIFAIRTLLKPAKESRVPLPVFLNFSTPHLLRAPQEFIAGKKKLCPIVLAYFIWLLTYLFIFLKYFIGCTYFFDILHYFAVLKMIHKKI